MPDASYIDTLPTVSELRDALRSADPFVQAQALATAGDIIDTHYNFEGDPDMNTAPLTQAETEADLMGRVVRALSDAGIIAPVVNPEFEIDTVTITGINLITTEGQPFTIGIDTL